MTAGLIAPCRWRNGIRGCTDRQSSLLIFWQTWAGFTNLGGCGFRPTFDFDTGVTSFNFDQLFTRNRFSGGDRVADANQLTVALTSRFNDLLTGAERARSVSGRCITTMTEVSLAGQGAQTRSESRWRVKCRSALANLEIRSSGLWDHRTETEEGRTSWSPF